MHEEKSAPDERALISNRTVDIVVALLLLGVCAIVIFDSTRLGFNWREGEGPAPGYYPFYVAVILGIASLVNLISALRGRGITGVFVTTRAFGRVLAVLVPSIIFVGLIRYIGLYASAALFIFSFMTFIGRENPLKAAAIAVAVPFVLFLMFEKWFLVPLPKGPIEAWLGY
jgi:putative tricarboxylic transport membrane protein